MRDRHLRVRERDAARSLDARPDSYSVRRLRSTRRSRLRLDRIIVRAMAKDPAARYQSALLLHSDLLGLKQEL